MTSEAWFELPRRLSIGQQLPAKVIRVDRWGILLDLNQPFPGFMDRLHVGDDLERYQVGDEVDVVIVHFAEYNRQIRVRPLAAEDPAVP